MGQVGDMPPPTHTLPAAADEFVYFRAVWTREVTKSCKVTGTVPMPNSQKTERFRGVRFQNFTRYDATPHPPDGSFLGHLRCVIIV